MSFWHFSRFQYLVQGLCYRKSSRWDYQFMNNGKKPSESRDLMKNGKNAVWVEYLWSMQVLIAVWRNNMKKIMLSVIYVGRRRCCRDILFGTSFSSGSDINFRNRLLAKWREISSQTILNLWWQGRFIITRNTLVAKVQWRWVSSRIQAVLGGSTETASPSTKLEFSWHRKNFFCLAVRICSQKVNPEE